MYAYVCPTNGEYVNERGEKVFNGDFRTEERYEEYKECGFDTLLLLGNDKYEGEPFDESALKRNLDLCEKTGLKCIVYDKAIYDLSLKTERLIGENSEFSSMEELTEFIIKHTAPYINHPAFRGLEIIDEPKVKNFPALKDLYFALRLAGKKTGVEIYVNAVLLPYFEGMEASYTEKPLKGFSAYRDYIKEWLGETGAGSFDFDVYPFVFGEGETEEDDGRIFPLYLANMQVAAKETQKKGAKLFVVFQSYASRAGAKGSAYKRKMSLADFRYQKNVALAFGAKDFRYYTYWLFPSQLGDPSSEAIMSEKGEKEYYPLVKKVNEELKAEFETLCRYEYSRTELIGELPHFKGVESEKISGAEFYSDKPVIVNEMTDGKNRGYFAINADNPKTAERVTLRFKCNGKAVSITKNGAKTEIAPKNGEYKIVLEAGEGTFIEPR